MKIRYNGASQTHFTDCKASHKDSENVISMVKCVRYIIEKSKELFVKNDQHSWNLVAIFERGRTRVKRPQIDEVK